jgi:hypothetical protein
MLASFPFPKNVRQNLLQIKAEKRFTDQELRRLAENPFFFLPLKKKKDCRRAANNC